MIITKLTGGLGNQMFQYAVARSLSLYKNIPFKLDINDYDTTCHNSDTLRKYALSIFNIDESFSTAEENDRLLGVNNIYLKMKCRIPNALRGYFLKQIFLESHYHYDSKIWQTGMDFYLIGYWQSEKYFFNENDQIRRDFTLKKQLSIKAKEWLRKINTTNAVSLHIRRGDYITNMHTNTYHGTCSPGYYFKASDIIKQRISNMELFIFSDDISWVKKNLKVTVPVNFVSDSRGIQDYEEMMLMSKCKHNIIANSSFSWWGAWLNQNRDKIVIAPKKWFADPNINTQDLIPDRWLRI